MFCNGCGRQVPDGIKFCPGCGKNLEVKAEPVKAEKKEKKSLELWKKPWVSLVAGILCGALVMGLIFGVAALAGGGNTDGGKVEGAGYGSAQDVAKAYLQAMKAGDVNKMASCFAVESYVDNYDAAVYAERVRSYQPGTLREPIAPVNTYFRDTKIGIRTGQVYQTIERQYMLLAGIEGYLEYHLQPVGDGERFEDGEELVEHFTDEDWMKTCANMKIGKIRDFENCSKIDMVRISEEHYEKQLALIEKERGCDKLEELMIEITLDGEEYLMALRMGRYDGKWYIVDTESILGNAAGFLAISGGCMKKDDIF